MDTEADRQTEARSRAWASPVLNPWVMLALAGLFWSGNHIAGRAGAGHIPPLALASFRWLLGAAIMYPFVHHHVRRDWPVIVANWKPVLAMSVLGGTIFSGMQYSALQHTTALNGSIFNSFAPAIIVLVDCALPRDIMLLDNSIVLLPDLIPIPNIVDGLTELADTVELLSAQILFPDTSVASVVLCAVAERAIPPTAVPTAVVLMFDRLLMIFPVMVQPREAA